MEWISVKDKLPQYDISVLVCDTENNMWVARRTENYDNSTSWSFVVNLRLYNTPGECCHCNHPDLSDDNVIYWSPLPEKPR
jgi:hypothetical protein